MAWDEELLPPEVLARAIRSGNEYAWRVDDIPVVIEGARKKGLLNIGGQLQFHLPTGVCECYWLDVVMQGVPNNLPWLERVELAADMTKKDYDKLRASKDFLAEARSAFEPHTSAYEGAGGRLEDVMCFVWYVEKRRLMPRWISNLFRR